MVNTSRFAPYALAALRIMAALLFIEHATQKFFQFPAPLQGVPDPLPVILIVAGTIEVVTGTLMVLGYQTRAAAFLASGLSAAAYFMAHAPQSFWPVLNMGEPAILFCFIFFFIAFAGGGAWALDRDVRKATSGPPVA
jgi:putative oxidoreductase